MRHTALAYPPAFMYGVYSRMHGVVQTISSIIYVTLPKARSLPLLLRAI